jgi:signal transduction histidine kinase
VEAGIDTAEMASKANRLADEQAALRRVATLVASSARPEQVFQIVAEEAGRLMEARTAATVRFDEEVVVEIRDNGTGGACMDRGSGLRGLADRIEALGGQLDLKSPSGGTVVRTTLPVR